MGLSADLTVLTKVGWDTLIYWNWWIRFQDLGIFYPICFLRNEANSPQKTIAPSFSLPSFMRPFVCCSSPACLLIFYRYKRHRRRRSSICPPKRFTHPDRTLPAAAAFSAQCRSFMWTTVLSYIRNLPYILLGTTRGLTDRNWPYSTNRL